MAAKAKLFHAFLSHSHDDSKWVEELARRLEDDCGFRVWLDKWILIPGKSWQQAMAKGLNEAATCAVCVGAHTPKGWFKEEIERALDIQTRDPAFRVIPVLLPDASKSLIPEFLSLRTWADFGKGQDEGYAFHVLKQGIRGEPIGKWPLVSAQTVLNEEIYKYEEKLKELRRFEAVGLSKEVKIEFERLILNKWLKEGLEKNVK